MCGINRNLWLITLPRLVLSFFIILNTIAIIAYPGSAKRRVLFIAGGITLLFISNVFRIIIFTLWRAYVPYFDIAHQYSGYILFYPIVLGLWYLWIKQTNIRTIDSILVSN